jgi:hypothetical protein
VIEKVVRQFGYLPEIKYICWISEFFAFIGVNANNLPDGVFCYLHTRTGIITLERKQTAISL